MGVHFHLRIELRLAIPPQLAHLERSNSLGRVAHARTVFDRSSVDRISLVRTNLDRIQLDRIHDHNFLQRSLPANGEHFLQLRFAREKNHPRARIAKNVIGLLGRERGIDRDRHRAQQQASEVCDHPLRPVLAQNGNPIASINIPASQRARYPSNSGKKGFRRNRNPPFLPPVQHNPGMPPSDHREKNVVKCPQSHFERRPQGDG